MGGLTARGQALLGLGRPIEGRLALHEAMRRSPLGPAAWWGPIAVLHYRAREWPAAESLLPPLWRAGSRDLRIGLVLMDLYHRRGSDDLARRIGADVTPALGVDAATAAQMLLPRAPEEQLRLREALAAAQEHEPAGGRTEPAPPRD